MEILKRTIKANREPSQPKPVKPTNMESKAQPANAPVDMADLLVKAVPVVMTAAGVGAVPAMVCAGVIKAITSPEGTVPATLIGGVAAHFGGIDFGKTVESSITQWWGGNEAKDESLQNERSQEYPTDCHFNVGGNSRESGSQSNLCRVCLSSRACVLFRPCNDLATCRRCLDSMKRTKARACPMWEGVFVEAEEVNIA